MDFRLLSDSRRFERMRNDVNVTGVTSWATDNAPVPRADTADVATIVAAASQQQTSLSQQAAEYKEGCLDDKTAEYQASDMGLLDGIEKDIQDLADF
ncbi:hypothetical protein BGX23_012745 [Mortierella sp. AD031]|nr:hypothetical protein BGX23_012745 [Mortierella sp. AD031]